MNRWLDNFAYRIELNWRLFALAGIIAVLIAFVTVGYQSLRAAWMDPVKALRDE